VNGRIISPYSWGLNKPLRTSSQTFQMKEDISLWFTDIQVSPVILEIGEKDSRVTYLATV